MEDIKTTLLVRKIYYNSIGTNHGHTRTHLKQLILLVDHWATNSIT